ncbi:MAG: SurA N-terminal domain-containing protein [Gammaproteobacteria bacterium]|jgi:parvulin-like peptidyl-prolyl isomerase
MLESVRSFLSGKTLFILVTLLAIPFVFFGSTSFGTVFTSYGTVNGETVTQTDINLASSNVTQRYQAIFGEDFSIETIGEEQFSESLRQEIINQKILLSAAKASDLRVGEKQAKKEIIKIENFQSDGKFDEALFQSVIRANGFTPDDYINLVQQTISMDFFIQGIANITSASENDITNFIIAFEKTRDLEFVSIDFNEVAQSIEVSDDEILDFYNSNPLLFLDDERRTLQYLTISSDEYADSIQVDDGLIKTAYEEYLAEQEGNLQRRASHIMLDVANYASKEEAINKISEIKSKLDLGSLSFVDAVTEFSEDDATVASGGDLGFSAGFAFPEEFESAIKAMPLNTISNIIDLEDTLHILKLTELIEPEIKSFEESAKELRAEFIASEATTKLQDAVSAYEERILNGESFEAIFAEENFLSLNNLSAQEVTQAASASLAIEAFNQSNDINTVSFIEGDEEVTFFTILNIVEPQLLSFEAAKSTAKDELKRSKAQIAIAATNSEIQENGLDSSLEEFQSYKAISRYSSLLPREVTNALFQTNLHELKKVELANGDLYWFKGTNESLPNDEMINEKKESYQLIVNQIQQQRFNVYLDSLLRDDLRVNLKNL